MNEFYISDGVSQFGPLTDEKIIDLINEEIISFDDLVFDVNQQLWSGIRENKYITQKLFSDESYMQNAKLHIGLDVPNEVEIENSKFFSSLTENSNSKISTGELSVSVKRSVNRWWLQEEKFKLGPYHYLTLLALWKQKSIDPHYKIINCHTGVETAAADFFANEKQNNDDLSTTKIELKFSGNCRRRYDRVVTDQLIFVSNKQKMCTVKLYDFSSVSLSFLSVDDYFFRDDDLMCMVVDRFQEQHYFAGYVTGLKKVKAINDKVLLKKYVIQFKKPIAEEVLQLFSKGDD